ncbi:MAG: TonB-dependent receptor [Steroidobacteraceae bacterium]
MNSNSKLSYAIATILSSSAPGFAQAALATDTTETSSDTIQEIVVTAQRREESAQNVPITIQAFTAETLAQLNVTTFDDYVKYVPNLTQAGAGPGQSAVFMRGLSTSAGGVQGSGATEPFPNVAIYLDEQSGQVPGRNLDIYAADLERVEILEGPQGTLFGAGAQAGVIRYITNKPKLDVTEGNVNAGYSITAGGNPSTNVDATINLPIIPDTLALRGVIYNESRGGYINNIPGTFSRAATDEVSSIYFGGVVPPNSGPISNNAQVANDINTVTYQGIRLSGLYKINDDWNALLSQTYQNMDSDGVFWQEEYTGTGQALPAYSVQLYNPTYDNDKFENTALTVNGRIGELKFIYAGSYLDRNVDQQQDYTNYSRGRYAGYYQCNYPGYPFKTVGGVITPTPGSAGFCYSPSAFWTDSEKTTHLSQEMRLSTPDDWRLRGLGGIFYEKYQIDENTDWHYGTSPNFVQIAPPPGATTNNPNVRPPGDVFFDDITRGYSQKAIFASGDFDILPNTLIATFGTRWYDINDFEEGSNVGSFGCEIYGPYNGGIPTYPCTLPETNGNNLNTKQPPLNATYKGFRSRANLTWHIDADRMVYYTWSQGFRPGGFNRASAEISSTSPLYGIFTPPIVYGPDYLTNNELGFKTVWLNHQLLVNGAIYQENWTNTQISIFDPSVTGNLTFNDNGPNYRVRGGELSVVARVTHELTITGSASYNKSEVIETKSFVNPTTGQPITIANPFGELGSPLANSPEFQGNIRARYEFVVNDYKPFVQVGATTQTYSYSTTDRLTQTLATPMPGTGAPGGPPTGVDFKNPGYSTFDASAGVGKDAWTASLYVDNLGNKLAWPYSFYAEYVKADTIIRPRTAGLRFSYKFGGQ